MVLGLIFFFCWWTMVEGFLSSLVAKLKLKFVVEILNLKDWHLLAAMPLVNSRYRLSKHSDITASDIFTLFRTNQIKIQQCLNLHVLYVLTVPQHPNPLTICILVICHALVTITSPMPPFYSLQLPLLLLRQHPKRFCPTNYDGLTS